MESRACASPGAPIVTTDNTCVSPRWKRPLPCVRGKRPVSMWRGRISVIERPSMRRPLSRISLETYLLNVSFHASHHDGFYGIFDFPGDQHFFYRRLKSLYQRHPFGASFLDGIEYPIVRAAFHQGLGFLFHRA